MQEVNNVPSLLTNPLPIIGRKWNQYWSVPTRYQQAYLQGFVVALLLCWSPSNLLGYLAPLAIIVLFIVVSQSQKTIRNLCIWIAFWMFWTSFHILFVPGFFLPSAVISLITYGAWMVVFVIPNRVLCGSVLWQKMLVLVRWVILIEAVLGIIQACYGFIVHTGSFAGTNGDHVEGTIHPALASELSFSNPMFAINITLMLLAILPTVVVDRKGKLPFILGLLSLILASVLHAIFLLGVAVALSIVLYRPILLTRKSGIALALFIMIGVVFAFSFLGNATRLLASFYTLTVNAETPKSIVVIRAFREMPADIPGILLIGTGPGQFSSRAGLIGTGLYFGNVSQPVSLPLFSPGMSDIFRDYVLDLWQFFPYPVGQRSSTTMPFFSWLSVYVEFGLLGFITCVGCLVWLLLRIQKRKGDIVVRLHHLAFGASAIFIFLLGIQENYWEVSQALLIGLMLMKVQFANLVYLPFRASKKQYSAVSVLP